MKLLIVEDNLELGQSMAELLRAQSFLVDHVERGDTADQLLRQSRYDVVLLDLNLPQMTGKALLRRLREAGNTVPVMVLTASASLDQKVQCLEMGADDYLVKPVEIRELVARIQALMRRQMPERENRITCADLHLDLRTRQFVIAGMPLTLPPRERSLLEALMLQHGRTLSKQALIDAIYSLDEEASADAIDIYISRLRKKLEASAASIMTLRGVGYLLRPRAEQ